MTCEIALSLRGEAADCQIGALTGTEEWIDVNNGIGIGYGIVGAFRPEAVVK